MEPIDVLDWIHGDDNPAHVDVRRQWLLDENAAHRLVPIQETDQLDELISGGLGGQAMVFAVDTDLAGVLLLAARGQRRPGHVGRDDPRQLWPRLAARG